MLSNKVAAAFILSFLYGITNEVVVAFINNPAIKSLSQNTRINFHNDRITQKTTRAFAWCDNSVTIEVPTSAEDAYSLYSQLEEHPKWSPWLKSVEFDEQSRESIWKLSTRGVNVEWKAINIIEEPGEQISWKSLTGVSNSGLVTFEDVDSRSCRVKLTVSYDIPSALAKVAKAGVISRFTEETLLGDLRRFKTELMKQMRSKKKQNAEKQQIKQSEVN